MKLTQLQFDILDKLRTSSVRALSSVVLRDCTGYAGTLSGFNSIMRRMLDRGLVDRADDGSWYTTPKGLGMYLMDERAVRVVSYNPDYSVPLDSED